MADTLNMFCETLYNFPDNFMTTVIGAFENVCLKVHFINGLIYLLTMCGLE